MEKREFGRTGLRVTPVGVGTAELGDDDVDQATCDRVLNAALDAGINVIDTAACYGSEGKIGLAVGGRRDEYVLITKCGHSVEGLDAPKWSGAIVRQSIDRSLRQLRTDRLDVLLLHSCTADRLKDDGLIEALAGCKQAGKTRFVGYSGDAEAAGLAVTMDVFDCLETSVSLCDQQALDRHLPEARRRDMGVIVKRPLANAAWRDASAFAGFYADYARPYIERLKAMGLTPRSVGFDGGWAELALRFAIFQPGAHTAITGSTSPDHLRHNVRIVEQGPLPEPVVAAVRDAWARHDDGSWTGQT